MRFKPRQRHSTPDACHRDAVIRIAAHDDTVLLQTMVIVIEKLDRFTLLVPGLCRLASTPFPTKWALPRRALPPMILHRGRLPDRSENACLASLG